MASKPGRPIFSERTRKATSVDSPIFTNSLLFKSNVSVESLHKDAHMDKCRTDGKSAGCFTTSLLMGLNRCCLGEMTPLDASRINPFGAYEFPSTSNSLNKEVLLPAFALLPPFLLLLLLCFVRSTTHIFCTHIAFVVKVPVLSEHTTVVHPKVSTDGNDLTIACLFAIFLVPNAKHVVTTAGKPSGIAATANATAIFK